MSNNIADSALFELEDNDAFIGRHIGPNPSQTKAMLEVLGVSTLDELIEKTVPSAIRKRDDLNLDSAVTETQALAELKAIAGQNKIFKSQLIKSYLPFVFQIQMLLFQFKLKANRLTPLFLRN